MTNLKHIVVAGAGGNIGSPLCALLARLPAVGEMTLVDPDVYEERNITGQAIGVRDIGRGKCRVQARNVRRIRPDLRVNAISARIEDVPVGVLRCDILCSALDSRISRIYLDKASYRLGGIWLVDGGVLGSQSLSRVSVYQPSDAAPCLECGWGEADYGALELEYPCRGNRPQSAPPTNANAYLGSVTAALMASECDKILNGRLSDSLAGQELVLGVGTPTHYVSRLPRNRQCRFDHVVWPLQTEGAPTLDMAVGNLLGAPDVEVRVFGGRFALRRTCLGCGRTAPVLQFVRNGQSEDATCASCGGEMQTLPFDWTDTLAGCHFRRDKGSSRKGAGSLRRTLARIGLRRNDLITLGSPGGSRSFLICG